MNVFSFCMFENFFISPLFLKEIFASSRLTVFFFLSFSTWKTLLYCLLIWIGFDEKSDIHTFVLLDETFHMPPSLAAVKIFFIYHWFWSVWLYCALVYSFHVSCIWSLTSYSCWFVIFIMFGMFSAIILNIYSAQLPPTFASQITQEVVS